MKYSIWHHLSVVFLLGFYGVAVAGSAPFKDSEHQRIAYPAWFKESFHDLNDDLKEAQAKGKQGLFILFTTEGCSYCAQFIARSLGDPEIAATLQKHFDSIGLEIFDDTEMTDPQGARLRVKQFAVREGAEFSPTILFYADRGEKVLRLTGYQSPERFTKVLDFVIGGHYRAQSFRAYLASAQGTPKLNGPATATQAAPSPVPPDVQERHAASAKKPVLVIFDGPDCRACVEFHAGVLALPEVARLLQHFDVVRLDVATGATVATPDGARLTPSAWFERADFSRLPALLFFDANGKEVLKTDALVLRQRMLNSLNFVLERAYEKGWSYQRFARTKALERSVK